MTTTRTGIAVLLALVCVPLLAADATPATTSMTYLCDDNQTITAVADNGDDVKITVSVDGNAAIQNVEMRYVMAANGEKASNGKLVWWTRGDEGFLANEDPPAGDGEVVIGGCVEKPAAH